MKINRHDSDFICEETHQLMLTNDKKDDNFGRISEGCGNCQPPILIIDDNNFNIFSLQCLLEMNFNVKSEFVSSLLNILIFDRRIMAKKASKKSKIDFISKQQNPKNPTALVLDLFR